MNAYRRRVLEHLRALLAPIAPVGRALDYGSGDGWFAHSLLAEGLIEEIVAVDVQRREHHFIEPQLYDGERLPFDDRSFDLVYAVDVLHHTPDPAASLRDLLRCSRRHFLLKDHNHDTALGKWTLALLDEAGNRKFGVPSLYHYQRRWNWLPVIEEEGFEEQERRAKILIEERPLLRWFVNEFQFVGRWSRAEAACEDVSA
ncbi:MAG: class I SAM-dependent methyltransferase [Acidobacteriota bacterium]